jgi:hypothetical protein
MSAATTNASQADRVLIAISRGLHTTSAIKLFYNLPSASVARACVDLRQRGLIIRVDPRNGPGHAATLQLTQRGAIAAHVAQRPKLPALIEDDRPTSERDTVAMRNDVADGSRQLLRSLVDKHTDQLAPADAFAASVTLRSQAGALSRVATGPGIDPRPVATSRAPCPRCAIRGDVGCRHQHSCAPIAQAFTPHDDLRTARDSSGNGLNFRRRAGAIEKGASNA